MRTSLCYSAHLVGLSAEIVTIEVDISNGLHTMSIIGLGDRSVEESKDRISAAIKNSGYVSPKQKNQKVIISLAPADIRKEGPAFDLPMALAYLAACGEIAFDPSKTLFLGELSLDGEVRPISGALPILCQARARGYERAFVPKHNQEEAALASGMDIYGVSTLLEAISYVTGIAKPQPAKRAALDPAPTTMQDMNTIRGNEGAKRGLEVAAAGGHNVLMYGPPGTGKTMLARSFPSILPPLSPEEMIEVTSIRSAARLPSGAISAEPPFRAPHHTASYVAIVGGGPSPRSGEVTLAHRGVLFLDEVAEFDRDVLEALRQPLEERAITISRARGTATFPAQCILLASMNPCPCGKPKNDGCDCSPRAIASYRRKVSGPIMDRLDIWLNIDKVDYHKLAATSDGGEPSEAIRRRVQAARDRQARRFAAHGIAKRLNGEISAKELEACAGLSAAAREELTRAAERLRLSGRAFHRTIKVARTVADLAGREEISEADMLEALLYRQRII